MATQIKVIKHSFKVEKHGQRTDSFYHDYYLDLSDNNPLLSFKETDNISLEFVFNSSEYQVEIESAQTGELIKVAPYKEFDLHLWDDVNSYFPGWFDIYITYNGTRTRHCFCVQPNSLDLESVLDLRNYVNDYYDGISLDLDRRRKMKVVFDYQNASTGDFSSYNFMLSNYPDLINYMNRYVKRRHEQLVKKDAVSVKSKTITSKSVKWLIQKGNKKNPDIYNPSVMLTSKTAFTLDNEQNRIFKAFVVYWDGELNRLLHNLDEYKKRVKNTLKDQENELKDLIEKKATTDSIKTISALSKKQLAGKIADTKAVIEYLNTVLEDYNDRYNNIRHYKVFTENVRHNTWVDSIDAEENYSHKRVSNKELLLIKEIRDRYLGVRRRISFGKVQKIDYFSEKSTPKLFETYLYVLLINILKTLGFDIDESLVGNNDLMYMLSSQSKMVLLNGLGYKCEIIYDKPLEDAQKEFVESDYCTLNSLHNRPDFIVSFISPDGTLLDTIIFEAKWRKLSNIYNDQGDTEVLTTLKDYSNLCYYDSNEERVKRGVISKVIALYPDFDENVINVYGGLISYCGLNICKGIDGTKNYAYLVNALSGTISKMY